MGPEERKLSEVESAEPDEVRRASSTWSRLSQDLGEVAAVLRGKVDSEIEGAWHGPAADLAREAFGAMAAAVETRAQSMDLVSRQLGDAATALATGKSELASLGPTVPPAPDPTGVDFGDPAAEITYAKLYSRHSSAAAEREENARRAYRTLESSLSDSESAMGKDMADDYRGSRGSTQAYTGDGGSGPSTVPGGYVAPGAPPSGGPGGGGPRSPILVPGAGPTDYQPGSTPGGNWTPGGTPSGDDDGGLTADAGPVGDATPWTPGAGGSGGGGETVPYGPGGGSGSGAGAVAGVGGVLGGALGGALGLGKAARRGGAGSVGGGSAVGARATGGRRIGGVAPVGGSSGGAGGRGGGAGSAGGRGGAGARGSGGRAAGLVGGGGGAGTSSGRAAGGARAGSAGSGAVRPSGSVGSAGGRAPAGAGGSSGGRGAPLTVAGRGSREKQDPEAIEALAVEDDWFDEDDAAPDVLR